MDIIVHGQGSDQKGECSVDAMSPGNDPPCSLERLPGLSVMVVLEAGIVTLHAAEDAFGLLGSGEFDDIGDEKMARDKSIKNGTEDEVLAPVVMTADANKDSVLWAGSERDLGRERC